MRFSTTTPLNDYEQFAVDGTSCTGSNNDMLGTYIAGNGRLMEGQDYLTSKLIWFNMNATHTNYDYAFSCVDGNFYRPSSARSDTCYLVEIDGTRVTALLQARCSTNPCSAYPPLTGWSPVDSSSTSHCKDASIVVRPGAGEVREARTFGSPYQCLVHAACRHTPVLVNTNITVCLAPTFTRGKLGLYLMHVMCCRLYRRFATMSRLGPAWVLHSEWHIFVVPFPRTKICATKLPEILQVCSTVV